VISGLLSDGCEVKSKLSKVLRLGNLAACERRSKAVALGSEIRVGS